MDARIKTFNEELGILRNFGDEHSAWHGRDRDERRRQRIRNEDPFNPVAPRRSHGSNHGGWHCRVLRAEKSPQGEAVTTAVSIKVGRIVKLKSGGPRMTVRKIHGADRGIEHMEIICDWFDERWPDQKSFLFEQLVSDDDQPLRISTGPYLTEPTGPHPDGEQP